MVKNITLFISFMWFSTITLAHELRGGWSVDTDSTVKYNSTNVGMTDSRKDLLKCMVRNTKLLINDDTFNDSVSSHTCTHQNKTGNIEGYENIYHYKILYDGEEQTAILISNDNKKERVDVINWIDSDTFWIDLQEHDFSLRRMRYFYNRLRN